jgi:hypothetical protein
MEKTIVERIMKTTNQQGEDMHMNNNINQPRAEK